MPTNVPRTPLSLRGLTLIASLALVWVGCDEDPPTGDDAGHDSGVGLDAGRSDAGGPAPDAGTDAGADAACTPACGACERCVDGACERVGGPHAVETLNSGWYQLLAIDADQVLYVWGENDNGQLGLGDTLDRDVATPLPGTWIAADGGSRHSCAVRSDGTLWCMGANVHGQLGNGDTDDRDVVTQVAPDAARDLDNPWVDVACGGLHTCGLKADASIWCFGSAAAGQLGLGTPGGDVHVPTRVGGTSPRRWLAVAALTRHTCAILESDQSVHCWGDNSDGQLGQGEMDRDDRHDPTPVVGADARFDAVRCGARHTCMIDDAGALDCSGANDFGYLGLGDTADRGLPGRVPGTWSDVAGGFEHSCGVTQTGELHCWGGGMFEQLGLGSTEMQTSPARVGSATDWRRIVAGYYHSCGLRADGSTWCWGDNSRGQQGAPIGERRPEPGRVCFAPAP